ncbi:MAG: DUF932 domain-containing protein, partial [Dehalococcoidia bacterium]
MSQFQQWAGECHDIQSNDKVGFRQVPAWHGLGILWPEEASPAEAAKMVGWDWEVEKAPLYAIVGDGVRVPVDGQFAAYRTDDQSILGVVSKKHQTLQPADFVEFVCAMADTDKRINVESCGTLSGGRRQWMLVKSDSLIELGSGGDQIQPYYHFYQGLDGGCGLWGLPTGIRVQCRNTQNMAVAQGRALRAQGLAFGFPHTCDLMTRLAEAKVIVDRMADSTKEWAKEAQVLATTSVGGGGDVLAFFKSVYEAYTKRPLATTTETKVDERRLVRARDIMSQWLTNF